MDVLDRADTYPMIVIAMTAVGWLALMVLFVATCHAARQGDHHERPKMSVMDIRSEKPRS